MIRILCETCGRPVRVVPGDSALWQRPDGCTLLRFRCPETGDPAANCVEGRDVDVLRLAGVGVFVVPEEALEPHHGPQISWDDLIYFHSLLGSADWHERLLRGGR